MESNGAEGRTAANQHSVLNRIALVSAILTAIIGGIAFARVLFLIAMSPELGMDLLKNHFLLIVGSPGSAYTAFIIVTLLRQADGPIEFEALGFKFKGAAGQVMLWAICYLVLVISLKLLW